VRGRQHTKAVNYVNVVCDLPTDFCSFFEFVLRSYFNEKIWFVILKHSTETSGGLIKRLN
jgi:hypothetical protein